MVKLCRGKILQHAQNVKTLTLTLQFWWHGYATALFASIELAAVSSSYIKHESLFCRPNKRSNNSGKSGRFIV